MAGLRERLKARTRDRVGLNWPCGVGTEKCSRAWTEADCLPAPLWSLLPAQQVKQFLLLSRQRPGLVAQCLRDSESSKPSFMPRLYINRRLAMEHRACPLRDPACKNAVFTQVWTTWGQSEGGSARGLGGTEPGWTRARSLGRNGAWSQMFHNSLPFPLAPGL